jgi:hypothetical protein
MLGQAAMRFVRTRWKGVQQLAEELYATFRPGMTIEPGQVIINQPPGSTGAPIIIRQPFPTGPDGLPNPVPGTGPQTPIITIERGGTTISLGDALFPDGEGLPDGVGGGGGVDLGDSEWPEIDPDEEEDAIPAATDTPFPLIGQVVSHVSGNNYTVRVWAKDPLTYPSLGTLTVRQMQIDASDQIPEDTWVSVICFPATILGVRTIERAVMQVPVFLADPEA